MKLKKLTTALILATLPATGVFAAALDRSGQSISAFLQPGNYFEAGLSVLDPSVSGKDTTYGTGLSDMADDYYFPSAALKLQLTDNFSFGLLYDQPFGADATYSPTDTTLPTGLGFFHNGAGESTEVEVKSQNISMIFGFQPNESLNFYAGPVYQTVKGNLKLRGAAYGGTDGLGNYNADMKEDGAVGWLAGAAFQIPEIALKASITYRSEIDHKAATHESGQSNILAHPLLPNPTSPIINANTVTEITTPQSVNLDFQTGIMANTVAFAQLRWVNWKDFAIRPQTFDVVGKKLGLAGQTPANPNGFDLVAYTDDQYSATVGVGRKMSEQWAGNVSVGYDTGSGNPVSTLGPTEGYWNVGLGLQFSPAPNYFIAGGVKYFWLGDAKAQPASMFGTSNAIADFSDNNAWAYGLKIGYKF